MANHAPSRVGAACAGRAALLAMLLGAAVGTPARGAARSPAAPGASESFSSRLEALIPDLASGDGARCARADDALFRLTFEATRPGTAGGDALAKALLAPIARRETPLGARVLLLNKLEYLGGWPVVLGARKILLSSDEDPRLREAARRVLAASPNAMAKGALRAALAVTGGRLRAGVIRALGAKRDPLAVGPLLKLATADDLQTRLAALEALAEIGEISCLGTIEEAIAAAKGGVEGLVVRRAYLRLADSLVDNAERGTARRIYTRAMAMGREMRAAALVGVARAKLQSEIPKIIAALDEEPVVREAALRAAELMKVPAMTAALQERLASARGELRAALVRVLAAHGVAPAGGGGDGAVK